jgi:hypothetical protein
MPMSNAPDPPRRKAAAAAPGPEAAIAALEAEIARLRAELAALRPEPAAAAEPPPEPLEAPLRALLDDLAAEARRHPLQALALASGLGLVLGLLAGRR